MIETILLDVGGILLLPNHRSVLQALSPLGLHPDVRGLDIAHYLALAEAENSRGQPVGFALGPYWVAYARAAGIAADLCNLAASAIQELQSRQPLFTRAAPGCRAGLRAVAATGAAIVLVSNTQHGHVERTVSRLGICQVGPGAGVPIRAVVDSHIVGIAKPDPAIFRLALERAGGAASTAVHVGDSLRADVRGALGAGIAALHFDPLGLCGGDDHPHAATLREVAAQLRQAPATGTAGPRARGRRSEGSSSRRARLKDAEADT